MKQKQSNKGKNTLRNIVLTTVAAGVIGGAVANTKLVAQTPEVAPIEVYQDQDGFSFAENIGNGVYKKDFTALVIQDVRLPDFEEKGISSENTNVIKAIKEQNLPFSLLVDTLSKKFYIVNPEGIKQSISSNLAWDLTQVFARNANTLESAIRGDAIGVNVVDVVNKSDLLFTSYIEGDYYTGNPVADTRRVNSAMIGYDLSLGDLVTEPMQNGDREYLKEVEDRIKMERDMNVDIKNSAPGLDITQIGLRQYLNPSIIDMTHKFNDKEAQVLDMISQILEDGSPDPIAINNYITENVESGLESEDIDDLRRSHTYAQSLQHLIRESSMSQRRVKAFDDRLETYKRMLVGQVAEIDRQNPDLIEYKRKLSKIIFDMRTADDHPERIGAMRDFNGWLNNIVGLFRDGYYRSAMNLAVIARETLDAHGKDYINSTISFSLRSVISSMNALKEGGFCYFDDPNLDDVRSNDLKPVKPSLVRGSGTVPPDLTRKPYGFFSDKFDLNLIGNYSQLVNILNQGTPFELNSTEEHPGAGLGFDFRVAREGKKDFIVGLEGFVNGIGKLYAETLSTNGVNISTRQMIGYAVQGNAGLDIFFGAPIVGNYSDLKFDFGGEFSLTGRNYRGNTNVATDYKLGAGVTMLQDHRDGGTWIWYGLRLNYKNQENGADGSTSKLLELPIDAGVNFGVGDKFAVKFMGGVTGAWDLGRPEYSWDAWAGMSVDMGRLQLYGRANNLPIKTVTPVLGSLINKPKFEVGANIGIHQPRDGKPIPKAQQETQGSLTQMFKYFDVVAEDPEVPGGKRLKAEADRGELIVNNVLGRHVKLDKALENLSLMYSVNVGSTEELDSAVDTLANRYVDKYAPKDKNKGDKNLQVMKKALGASIPDKYKKSWDSYRADVTAAQN